MSTFTMADVDEFGEMLHREIDAPFVNVRKSTLGGEHRVSLMVWISLDDPSTWSNGIRENSRYVSLHIGNNGEIELISDSGRKGHGGMMEKTTLSKRFRKTKYKSFEDAIDKINKYLDGVK